MVEQAEQTTQDSGGGSGMGSTALKAAAAAAAAGAAAVVARKALSHDEGGSGSSGSDSQSNGNGGSKSGALGTIAAGGWEAARDALLPAAENAAGAAGAFVAENAPEVVRDRIVPRFIESFNDSRGG
jgi:hypothetical protein